MDNGHYSDHSIDDCSRDSFTVSEKNVLTKVVPKDAWNQKGGYFRCFFWRYGEWETVYIDDFLPVVNGTQLWEAESVDDRNEMWPALLEKAFARFHGSYNSVYCGQSGDAFLALTGGCSKYIDFDEELEGNPTKIVALHRVRLRRLLGDSLRHYLEDGSGAIYWWRCGQVNLPHQSAPKRTYRRKSRPYSSLLHSALEQMVNFELTQEKGGETFPIGLRVYEMDQGYHIPEPDDNEHQNYLISHYDNCPRTIEGEQGIFMVGSSNAVVTYQLPPGRYFVLLHADDASQEKRFALVMRSTCNINPRALRFE